jgi:hypothetical protein
MRYLNDMYQPILSIIRGDSKSSDGTDKKLLERSALSALEVIISTMGNFLSPHLVSTLCSLCSENMVKRKSNEKLKRVLRSLRSSVPTRLLLPAIFDSYSTISQFPNHRVCSIYCLFILLLSFLCFF